MNNNDTKIVIVFMLVLLLIAFVGIYISFSGLDLSNSDNVLWKSETRLSELRMQNTSALNVFSGMSADITGTIQFIPMVIALTIVIAVCIGLYGMIKQEKKKNRVTFVKGRDIKKIAPDAYAKVKQFEKEQIRNLNRQNKSFENIRSGNYSSNHSGNNQNGNNNFKNGNFKNNNFRNDNFQNKHKHNNFDNDIDNLARIANEHAQEKFLKDIENQENREND